MYKSPVVVHNAAHHAPCPCFVWSRSFGLLLWLLVLLVLGWVVLGVVLVYIFLPNCSCLSGVY